MIAGNESQRRPEPVSEPSRASGPEPEVAQEFGGLFQILEARLAEIVGHASALAEVRRERARVALRRGVSKAILVVLLALVVLVVAFEASRQLASGLAGGLEQLTGRVWAGELGSGLVLLALVFGGWSLLLRTIERGEFRRRMRRHEDARDPTRG